MSLMETTSVTATAERMGVTQPAVSRMIAQLEATVGRRLFRRQGGRLLAGTEAWQLYRESERLFRQYESLTDRMAAFVDAKEGRLTIAAIPTLAGTAVAEAVGRFRSDRPRVRIELLAYPAKTVVDMVSSHRADVGFINDMTNDVSVMTQTIASSRVLCLLPPGHELQAKAEIAAADLAREPLVFFSDQSPPSVLVRQSFAAAGVEPIIVAETNLSFAAAAMARARTGIAVVDPLAVLWRLFPEITARPFVPTITIRAASVQSAFRPLSSLAQAFMAELQQVFVDAAGRDTSLSVASQCRGPASG
jgi:DNA-binding transcriptional LysR family regulator